MSGLDPFTPDLHSKWSPWIVAAIVVAFLAYNLNWWRRISKSLSDGGIHTTQMASQRHWLRRPSTFLILFGVAIFIKSCIEDPPIGARPWVNVSFWIMGLGFLAQQWEN